MTIETIATWLAENWHRLVVPLTFGYIGGMLGMVSDAKTRALPCWALAWRTFLWPIVVPLDLATWPLRRLWRWWRGRKAIKKLRFNGFATPVSYQTSHSLQAAVDWALRYYNTELRNSARTVDPDNRVIRPGTPVPYGGSRPDESKWPVTEERLRHVLSDYVRPCDLEPMIERVAALEAKEAPKQWLEIQPRADSYIADFGTNPIRARRIGGTPTPAPMVPEVRVYVDTTEKCEQTYVQVVEGGQRWWRFRGRWHGVWTDGCEEPWPPHWRKLGTEEARTIVAEWRAWRAAQK